MSKKFCFNRSSTIKIPKVRRHLTQASNIQIELYERRYKMWNVVNLTVWFCSSRSILSHLYWKQQLMKMEEELPGGIPKAWYNAVTLLIQFMETFSPSSSFFFFSHHKFVSRSDYVFSPFENEYFSFPDS